jgi:hypothetical protein
MTCACDRDARNATEAEELTRAAEVLEDTGGLTDREATPAVLRVLGPMIGRATVQQCVAALLSAATPDPA